jgi:hypothetical protein
MTRGGGGVVAARVTSFSFSCVVCSSLRSPSFCPVRLFIVTFIFSTVAIKAALCWYDATIDAFEAADGLLGGDGGGRFHTRIRVHKSRIKI